MGVALRACQKHSSSKPFARPWAVAGRALPDPPRRPRRSRHQSAHGAFGCRSARGRRRRVRLPRHDRTAVGRHRPHVRARRRAAPARARRHHRSPVRVGAAVGALRRPGRDVGHDGRRHRRRRAEHVAGADPRLGHTRPGRGLQPVHQLARLEHDLRRGRGQPVRRRRDDGRQVGPHPRRDGGVRRRVARAGAARPGRGPLRQRDRADQRRRARRGPARTRLGQDPLAAARSRPTASSPPRWRARSPTARRRC